MEKEKEGKRGKNRERDIRDSDRPTSLKSFSMLSSFVEINNR